MLVDFPGDGHGGSPVLYPMSFVDHAHWHFRLVLTKDQAVSNEKLSYQYLFEDENGVVTRDYCKNRFISLENGKTDLVLLASWVDMVLGISMQPLGWKYVVDNLFAHCLLQIRQTDIGRMLS